MIINEGSKIPRSQFKILIDLKFLFTILSVIVICLLWMTMDNNIFAGLSMTAINDKKNYKYYKEAWRYTISFLVIFSIFLFVDLVIQILGLTYNFYKLNIITLSLKILEFFLLAVYFLDSWNYFGLLWIFIVTQFFCTALEITAISFACCCNFKKYNIIKNNEVRHIKTD